MCFFLHPSHFKESNGIDRGKLSLFTVSGSQGLVSLAVPWHKTMSTKRLKCTWRTMRWADAVRCCEQLTLMPMRNQFLTCGDFLTFPISCNILLAARTNRLVYWASTELDFNSSSCAEELPSPVVETPVTVTAAVVVQSTFGNATWIYLDLLGSTWIYLAEPAMHGKITPIMNHHRAKSDRSEFLSFHPGHCQWLKGHVSDAFYISHHLTTSHGAQTVPAIPGGESLCGPEDQRLPDSAELLWPRGSGRAHPIPGLCSSTQSAKFSAFKEFHTWNSEPLLLDLLECHKWKMCIAEPAACCFLGVFS